VSIKYALRRAVLKLKIDDALWTLYQHKINFNKFLERKSKRKKFVHVLVDMAFKLILNLSFHHFLSIFPHF